MLHDNGGLDRRRGDVPSICYLRYLLTDLIGHVRLEESNLGEESVSSLH
jgi:hypothetical protein